MNVAAEPLSRKKIGAFAYELRRMMKFENTPFFPIVHFIEWVLANPESGMDFEIVPEDEMSDTYGTTNTGKNKMIIREDVYNRAVQGNPRDRFTLCHELGHYLLHQPENISYARGDIPAFRNPEWQANTFAAELMAPGYLIQNMSVSEIVEKCGVSRQAAEIQKKSYTK
ncbi:ImmA/IrrE family metallo-endopeptidase [Blautia schinkii]|nr:ImmA/IrrE family metallo-endopeptidase [Blautia schinkii]